MIVVWFVFISLILYFEITHPLSTWVWMVTGTMYIMVYLNNYLKNYLTVKGNLIIENAFFGKRINLNEVVSFKALFGDYILKTNDKELVVNTQFIDHQSLKMLNESLAKYDYFQLE